MIQAFLKMGWKIRISVLRFCIVKDVKSVKEHQVFFRTARGHIFLLNDEFYPNTYLGSNLRKI